MSLFNKKDNWLIVLSGDPDALASAMALKRILARRVNTVGIAMVNQITRPDNLAMVRYLQIPIKRLTPPLAAQYDKFALVDSQPSHNPAFSRFNFSIIFDHHPISPKDTVTAPFTEIHPAYGANSTLLTEFLYNLKIRPGKLLSTALLYGIKTDTHSFELNFHDADIRAFRYLSKYADHTLLRKIVRSEFRVEWLTYFSYAFRKMRLIGDGLTVFMGQVDSTDILVILADFFLRVHDVSWNIVSGIFEDQLVIIFRGDGIKSDMGNLAGSLFGDLGSAGGKKAMARAEIPLRNLNDEHPQKIIWERLQSCKLAARIGIKSFSENMAEEEGPEEEFSDTETKA